MTGRRHQGKAAGAAAALLVLLGVMLGIAVDRLVLGRVPVAAASPLTIDAMVKDLDLDTLAQARVRGRLDSLEAAVARAAELGADSLRTAARRARQALEDALPSDRRARFRSWMDDHRSQMMGQMRGRGMGGMHRGMSGEHSGDGARPPLPRGMGHMR